MKTFSILILLLSSTVAFGLETDNYIVWGKELKDSSSLINSFLHEEIRDALENQKGTESCFDITLLAAAPLESKLVHDNPVENHLMSVLREEEEEIFPQNLKWSERSIYRDPWRPYIPLFGLAPNVQVNGFYFGTDKLSHFASTGRQYYQQYQKALKKGLSENEAVIAAIRWGIEDENKVHGYWASGVFSFADMEANYQGFLFYKDLCLSLFSRENGRWVIKSSPKIENFVSGLWDESFNPSYRLPENWKKVAPSLKSYCPHRDSPEVRARFATYQRKHKPTFSHDLLLRMRKEGNVKVPDPEREQSFTALCR